MRNDAAHRETEEESKPTLYVVATPIGNLGDITLRALEVLKRVALIAAEDTRVAARLLGHFGIAGRLTALHEHNERRAIRQVLGELARGRAVALVSDAGTPTVSDPGAQLVAAARAAGFRVSPLPGPGAALAALSAAGFDSVQFLFYGFLPPRAGPRRRALAALAGQPFTLIFFEAPHRIAESIRDMRDALGGERRVVLARELTKIFEQIHACTLDELVDWLASDPDRQRGEFVLVVEGAHAKPAAADQADARRVLEILLEDLPVKQAAALAAKITGGRKNELYALALKLKRDE
jgi:16S rRNA (cytidine1402-2'-O)-methyltransferase